MKIIWNDILKEKVDALVTPASRNPQIGTGLDRIIHKAAGPQLLEARKTLGRIEPGKVGVSKAFGVTKTTKAKWIIHALGPVWNKQSGRKEELILDGCYLRILCKAAELGCSSIALPVLSSGKFGMPMGKAIDIAVNAITDFSAAFPKMDVRLVGIDADFYEYSKKHYPNLTVAKIDTKTETDYRKAVGSRDDDPSSLDDAFTIGDESDYFDTQLLDQLAGDGTFKGMFRRLWDYTQRREKAAKAAKRKKHLTIEENEFVCGKKELAVATGIGENTIKHFCSNSGKESRTSRDKIIALGVAMKLPLTYVQRFLATCNYKIPNESPVKTAEQKELAKRDKIIVEFIEKCRGSVDALNYELTSRRLSPLSVDS